MDVPARQRMGSTILSINSNVSSLKARRQLGTATDSLSSASEKLSSGMRLTRACDDAAGLAVASSLRADTRIYSQGTRNLNDGVSALNIADGALSNLSSIIVRMQELAEQAANGAVGWKQRKSLDAEAQALAKEYSRISRTTDFNGLKLLDGSIQGLSLQAGYGNGGSILSSLGGALGTGTFGASLSYQTQSSQLSALSIADLNGDGAPDLVTAGTGGGTGRATIQLGNGDGTFNAAVSYRTEASFSNDVSLSDVNGDAVLDLVTAGSAGVGQGGFATISLGNGDGTFKRFLSYQTESGTFSRSSALSMSDVDGDGNLDMLTAGSDGTTSGWATIRLGNGNGSFKKAVSYQTEAASSAAVATADLNADGLIDVITAGHDGAGRSANVRLGNGDGTFKSSVSCQISGIASGLSMSDVNSDGHLDLVTAGTDGNLKGSASISLGNGDGTFKAALSYSAESGGSDSAFLGLVMSDLSGDGVLDLVTVGWRSGAGGLAGIRLGNGDGTFRALSSFTSESTQSNALCISDVNGDGVVDLVTAGTSGASQGTTVFLANTRDGVSAILPFSLKTQADALQALPMLQKTLDRLSMQRGEIGSFQSRLSSALNTLGSIVLEYKSAQARVEDVDVANESASLVRQQIVQQAASSVLAQANQAPNLALMLLKG